MSLENSDTRRPAPPRLGLTVEEAAEAVGMSESSFKRHVQPELRIVRRGSLRIIPVPEIERWLEGNAALAGTANSASRMARTTKRPRAVGAAGGMAHREEAP
jgi:AraC-like DNA-binding protein